MNAFAYRVMTLPQIVLILLTIGLMVAGAVLAARQYTTDDRLTRAPYFALSALIGLALIAAQVIWFVTGPAVAGGWLWILFVIYIAAFVLGGYLLFPIARARSRDAYGHADMAFLTFIPIANLWLLLKPSQGQPQAPHGLAGATGVVIGLVALGLTGWLNVALPGAVQRAAFRYEMANPMSAEDRTAMMIETMGLQAALEQAVANTPTPMTVDAATILQVIAVQGTRIVHTYTATVDVDALPQIIAARLGELACNDLGIRELLDAGATMEHTYLRTDGSVIGTVSIDSTACGT